MFPGAEYSVKLKKSGCALNLQPNILLFRYLLHKNVLYKSKIVNNKDLFKSNKKLSPIVP